MEKLFYFHILLRTRFFFVAFERPVIPVQDRLFVKSSRPAAIAVAYMSIEVYLYSVCVRHIVSAFIVYFCHMERNEYNCMIAIEELRPRK